MPHTNCPQVLFSQCNKDPKDHRMTVMSNTDQPNGNTCNCIALSANGSLERGLAGDRALPWKVAIVDYISRLHTIKSDLKLYSGIQCNFPGYDSPFSC